MLELKGVSKRYGKKEALHDVNIQFKTGIYGLLGPNGAGKSTLMNIVSDILEPTTGTVIYEGKEIWKLKEKYRKNIGYLPQRVKYYSDFPAGEDLQYFAVLRGVQKSEIAGRVDSVLEMVHLSEHKNEKVKTFSGGMKQRLGIAVTLVGDPQILIMDEPTVGLDPKERLNFRNLLSNLAEDKTIILSTHIVSDIDSIAKYVILIKEGNIIGFEEREQAAKLIADEEWSSKKDSITLEDVYMYYFNDEAE